MFCALQEYTSRFNSINSVRARRACDRVCGKSHFQFSKTANSVSIADLLRAGAVRDLTGFVSITICFSCRKNFFYAFKTFLRVNLVL